MAVLVPAHIVYVIYESGLGTDKRLHGKVMEEKGPEQS